MVFVLSLVSYGEFVEIENYPIKLPYCISTFFEAMATGLGSIIFVFFVILLHGGGIPASFVGLDPIKSFGVNLHRRISLQAEQTLEWKGSKS